MTHARILVTVALLASGVSAQRPDNASVAVGFLEQVYGGHQVEAAARAYLGDLLVQHGPTVPDGRQAYVDALTAEVAANPAGSIEVAHVVADGSLVLVHSNIHQQPGDLGVAAVDIFRVRGGRLIEHWEVRQPVVASKANSHSMFDSVYPAAASVDARTVTRNKAAARLYMAQLFDPARSAQAVRTYLPAEGYIQHNPNIPDGAASLESGLQMGFKNGSFVANVKEVLGQGDLVATYSEYRIGVPGQGSFDSATIDLFRFKDGQIVEHWDVGEPVAPKPANSNGQF